MIDFKLYLITDRHQTGGKELLYVVREALEGGVRAIQLREKDMPSAAIYRLATDLRFLTREFDAQLMINDRLDIALAVDADGVQIGVNSLPVAQTRRLLGTKRIIGYSAHGLAEARQAQMDGADFVTLSPVYATPSKSGYGAPCGVKKLAEAAAALEIPVIALGGISTKNISQVLSAKIEGFAVISAIISAADPRVATASLLKKIEEYAKHAL